MGNKPDLRTDGLSVGDEVSRREFDHILGFKVLEMIARWKTGGMQHFKLMWIRVPMIATQIQGVNNPFVHCDFGANLLSKLEYTSLRKEEEMARTKVETQFNIYWSVDWLPKPDHEINVSNLQ